MEVMHFKNKKFGSHIYISMVMTACMLGKESKEDSVPW